MTFYFESAAAFWHMEGHGPYVWVCYVVTMSIFMGLALAPKIRRAKFIKQQRALVARQQASREASLEVER
ncbi:heme exporter protein CcmD [Marinagarivorans algicola]|uniref:heme exporter protein CcmD n=1 Tax=Marinagarivorans algicola TaxID=1513270 RepID=UPI0006B3FBD9|nr:heme exporter protein CcmD [Marinagarivorans algicola]